MVISPDYVELWEAIITFLMFPFMVILAYLADKGLCSKKKVDDETEVQLGFGKLCVFFVFSFNIIVIIKLMMMDMN